MAGLIFKGSQVTHHCKREAQTGLGAVATDLIATEENQTAAAILVGSCIEYCRSVCPEGCELRALAGLSNEQMNDLLRLSEI